MSWNLCKCGMAKATRHSRCEACKGEDAKLKASDLVDRQIKKAQKLVKTYKKRGGE